MAVVNRSEPTPVRHRPRFVIARPAHVVPFTGTRIGARKAKPVTDWHVVDQRGRTLYVVPYTAGYSQRVRREYAERHARVANGLRGWMRRTRAHYGWRWHCGICGAYLKGPR